jgi:hypothetical protein
MMIIQAQIGTSEPPLVRFPYPVNYPSHAANGIPLSLE